MKNTKPVFAVALMYAFGIAIYGSSAALMICIAVHFIRKFW